MENTPELPSWIRSVDVPGYTSAHRLCPTESRLFGTESLYGDWSGRVLLLAKDFAPSKYLHEGIARRDPCPYRHDPLLRANLNLQSFAGPLRHLGLLYGSALANLLRDDGRWTGTLPNRRQAVAYGTEVVRFTVERMPALQWIVCLGGDAWDAASRAFNLHGNWAEHRNAGKPLGRLWAAFHPSARVSRVCMHAPWNAIYRAAGVSVAP